MAFRVKLAKNDELDCFLDKSIIELGHFFNMTWTKNRPCIFLVQDRKTIDLLRGETTPDWLVGWSNGKDIFMLDEETFENESCHAHSDKEYFMLLKHELVHCFCNIVFPWFGKPLWLREGIAIYLAGQCSTKKRPETFREFLSYIESGGDKLYSESGFAVEILVREFGWNKIIDLIKGLRNVRSNKDFEVLFEKVYGFCLDYEEFERLRKNRDKNND
jgi:hypothetical protein